MKRWAALLRGVNLGGRKLLMSDLAALTAGLGFSDVRTVLASGNVVFASNLPPQEIERRLEAALAAHGLITDVMVRDRSALAAVIARNPWPDAAADHPSHYLVTFHRDPFPADTLARLAEGPERLHVSKRELYTDFHSQSGMRETTLIQRMAKAKFPKVATGRNWNTVQKLAALL